MVPRPLLYVAVCHHPDVFVLMLLLSEGRAGEA